MNGIKDLSKIYRKIILGKLSPKDFYIIYNKLNIVVNIVQHISKDDKLLDFINMSNILEYIKEVQIYIETNINLEYCKKYDDISFDKFNLNYIHEIMLFNLNYNDKLTNDYNIFLDNYNKFIHIKNDLDKIIKDNEQNTKKQDNNDYIKIHECPKTEPALVGTTRRLNILKKIDINAKTLPFLKDMEIKNHNGSNSMIYSPNIHQISKSIFKYKDIFLDNLSKLLNKILTNWLNKKQIPIN